MAHEALHDITPVPLSDLNLYHMMILKIFTIWFWYICPIRIDN